MKSLTGRSWIVAVITAAILSLGTNRCLAIDVGTFNPIEIGILYTSNDSLNKKLLMQTAKEAEIFQASTVEASEMSNITKWERKYSKYLREAKSYAQQAQAATGIYTQTIRILINLTKLKKAVEYNPSGMVSSALLTENYIKVADEIIISFALLKQVFSKGGDNNMLNGKDRAQVWWDLNDTLERVNNNLYRLAYSIAYYNLVDVWNNFTQGFFQRSHGTIAKQALGRWRKVAKVEHILNN